MELTITIILIDAKKQKPDWLVFADDKLPSQLSKEVLIINNSGHMSVGFYEEWDGGPSNYPNKIGVWRNIREEKVEVTYWAYKPEGYH